MTRSPDNVATEFRLRKTILVATPRIETAAHLAQLLSDEGWGLGLPKSAQSLKEIVARGDIDLAIVDESWMDEDLIDLLHKTGPSEYGTRFAVILDHSQEVEALEWMRRGGSAFFHEPIAAVPQSTLVFVLKSIFRTVHFAPNRAHLVNIREVTGRWIRLSGPSHQGVLEQFQRFFAVLHASRMTEDEKRMLHLAINEIGMNAIEWGNRKDANRMLTIDYRFEDDRILVRIEDEGAGFIPVEVPDPTKDPAGVIKQRKAAGKRLGGYGLALVRNIMDEVEFNERGNVVTMNKKLRRASGMFPSVRDDDKTQVRVRDAADGTLPAGPPNPPTDATP